MVFSPKFFKFLLVLAILGGLRDEASANPQMSWYYQGNKITTNTTIQLNLGDTFIAQCKGAANNTYATGHFIDFFITKGQPATYKTVTFTDSSSGNRPEASISSGTFVYNNYDGNAAGYDHWYVSPYYVQLESESGAYPYMLAHIAVPRLSLVDAGTYFCAFYDASGETYSAYTFAWSYGLTLQINTPSGYAGASAVRSKLAEYSLALFTAYTVMF